MALLPPGPVLVSACLLGAACRYDGCHRRHLAVVELARGLDVVRICPETMGGLRAPRPPAEIVGGDGHDVLAGRARVLDREGRDVTREFIRGAERVLALAKRHGARAAILKAKSPSCAVHSVYDGTFSGRLKPGMGVAAALLAGAGLDLLDEEDLSGS